MSPHDESDQKPVQDRLLAGVRALCRNYAVESVSGDRAGHCAEFGITIHLASGAREVEVASLRKALSLFLDAFHEALSPKFRWVVMFRRGDKALDPLRPGDRPPR
jgi:hypothetical protein